MTPYEKGEGIVGGGEGEGREIGKGMGGDLNYSQQ